MNHFARLKRQLESKPFLLADAVTGEIVLADASTALSTMSKEAPFPTHAIIVALSALERFSELEGVGKDDREFSLKEIAQIAGMSYALAHVYMHERILTPSIRATSGSGKGNATAIFSWTDAYVAGLVGSLHRHGLDRKYLREVAPLFKQPEMKQAAGKTQPRKRP